MDPWSLSKLSYHWKRVGVMGEQRNSCLCGIIWHQMKLLELCNLIATYCTINHAFTYQSLFTNILKLHIPGPFWQARRWSCKNYYILCNRYLTKPRIIKWTAKQVLRWTPQALKFLWSQKLIKTRLCNQSPHNIRLLFLILSCKQILPAGCSALMGLFYVVTTVGYLLNLINLQINNASERLQTSVQYKSTV